MSLSFLQNEPPPIIMVLGVGGAGCNAVSNMYHQGIHGVDFVVCNTDSQVLGRSPVQRRLLIGQKLTGGLGCGADPEQGRKAAEESLEEIQGVFSSYTRMVFLTAGMGGGTGTGASPVIARLCKERGLLTVGVVSLPFGFEGEPRKRNALKGLTELERYVDALVVIHNNNILKIAPRNTKQKEAFLMADQVLYRAVRGIAEIITKPGYINVDFADVQTIMKEGGYALLGMSSQQGENRALLAVEEALSSPLLDNVDISGAKGILVNITASEDTLTVQETEQIMTRIQEALGPSDAHIIMGQVFDEKAGDELSLTVIATGLERPKLLTETIALALPMRPVAPPLPASLEPELPLPSEEKVPSVGREPKYPPPLSREERLRQLDDPRALEKARAKPAFERWTGGGTRSSQGTPPLSSLRIEPTSDHTNPPLRRHNPRLYDNAD
ncbi:MAG: cell division protein FtsZ [Bacteroidia bacterium]|nr:cell division protein FtsZ [Bacteroidia bacterium]MDW8236329.1 cell division protein FtsZ [Bacteroidia bacterium]